MLSGIWPGLRGRYAPEASEPVLAALRASFRCRPYCGRSEAVAFDNQPTLGLCVSTGCLKYRHLPVADVRCPDKVVKCQLAANTAISVVPNYVEQSSNFWFCGCKFPVVSWERRSIIRNSGHDSPRGARSPLSAIQSG